MVDNVTCSSKFPWTSIEMYHNVSVGSAIAIRWMRKFWDKNGGSSKLLHRAKKQICSTPHALKSEQGTTRLARGCPEQITNIFETRGYNLWMNQQKTTLTKPKNTIVPKNCIYSIPCQCGTVHRSNQRLSRLEHRTATQKCRNFLEHARNTKWNLMTKRLHFLTHPLTVADQALLKREK